jgi:hypothetical protein
MFPHNKVERKKSLPTSALFFYAKAQAQAQSIQTEKA